MKRTARVRLRLVLGLLVICVVGGIAWWLDIPSLLRPSPGHLDHFSFRPASMGGRPTDVYVWVPPGYGAKYRRFPVMYVLHGWPGSPKDFFVKGRIADSAEALIKAGELPPLLIVAVDGHGPGFLGYGAWANAFRGHFKLATMVSHDLVGEIDTRYRTDPSPGSRVLMGISEGGYGAVNIGLKHAGVFGSIVSHSGHYTASRSRLSNKVFGTGEAGAMWRRNNSPLIYLAQWATVPRSVPIYMDTTFNDDDYRDSSDFARLLRIRGIPCAFHVSKGAHTWRAWRDRFPDSLKWVGRRLGAGM